MGGLSHGLAKSRPRHVLIRLPVPRGVLQRASPSRCCVKAEGQVTGHCRASELSSRKNLRIEMSSGSLDRGREVIGGPGHGWKPHRPPQPPTPDQVVTSEQFWQENHHAGGCPPPQGQVTGLQERRSALPLPGSGHESHSTGSQSLVPGPLARMKNTDS